MTNTFKGRVVIITYVFLKVEIRLYALLNDLLMMIIMIIKKQSVSH